MTSFLEDQLVHFRVHRTSSLAGKLAHIVGIPMVMGATYVLLGSLPLPVVKTGAGNIGVGFLLTTGLSIYYMSLDAVIGAVTSVGLFGVYALSGRLAAGAVSPVGDAAMVYGAGWAVMLMVQRVFELRRASTFGNFGYNMLLGPFLTTSELLWPLGYKKDLRRQADIRAAIDITRLRRDEFYSRREELVEREGLFVPHVKL